MGGVSKPSTSRPSSSLIDKLKGPWTRRMFRARSHDSAVLVSAWKTSGSSSAAMQPKSRSAEQTSELQSLMRSAYSVFGLHRDLHRLSHPFPSRRPSDHL